MIHQRISSLHVLLLVLSLLFGQHAAIAHALSHLPGQAAVLADGGQDEEGKGERLGHRCHECLAYSALDAPLATAQWHVPLQTAPVPGRALLPGGIAAAPARHFDSRAPPRSL